MIATGGTPPRHLATGQHVVVVGGGVIGAMCARSLVERGLRVTVVDRERFGAACSHGNCGYVCPSHVLPLCQPGAVQRTMRAMLGRNSPFAIKPRLSRRWASWFWNFARRCNERDMLDAANGIHALLQSSMELYRAMVAAGVECEWQERGLIFVHGDRGSFEAFRETEALVRDRFGVTATPYPGDEVLALEPALKPGLGGAWHYEGDCHLRPDVLMRSLRADLEERGVRFVEGAAVDGFELGAGTEATAVRAGGESIEADGFVVATGAMTPLLEEPLGFRVPIEPGKGYSITTSRPERAPRHPLIFEDSHVAITPMDSGYRIGSTMEFVGYSQTIHPRRLKLLTDAAQQHLVDPMGEVQETWYGWRPMTWDGRPLIDRAPAIGNVWIAAGHSMLGLSMAPGTGRLVAELVTGDAPHIDPAPYGLAVKGLVRR